VSKKIELDILGCTWVGLASDGAAEVVLVVSLGSQEDTLCAVLRRNADGEWQTPALQHYDAQLDITDIELGDVFPADWYAGYVNQLIGAAKLARAEYIRTDGYGIPF
jgi:hypothetical protein